MQIIFLQVIPQIVLRTLFTQLFNHVKFSNEFNFPLFSGLLDYPGMQNSVLASKRLQYKINNWQKGCGLQGDYWLQAEIKAKQQHSWQFGYLL